MPIGLLGAFKFCDGDCSLKHHLLHWLSPQVEEARWDEQFWPLCSHGRSSVRPKMHQTGTYNIDDLIGNVPNSQGRVVGTGGLENCCWNRLITTFLPILVCNCPLESPEMQKPGRSETWSRCWTVRTWRRERDLSIKACWALPVKRRLGHSLAWSNQVIPT